MWLLRIGSVRYARTLSVVALFVLVLGLVAPTTAWASEGEEESTGFKAGLETFFSPDEVRQEVQEDYFVEPEGEVAYTPMLLTEGEGGEEPTTVSYIDQFIGAVNSIGMYANSGRYSLLESVIRLFTMYPGFFMAPAIGIVFLWWGVRKVVRIIMSAWRRGRASV